VQEKEMQLSQLVDKKTAELNHQQQCLQREARDLAKRESTLLEQEQQAALERQQRHELI
jgi:ABC-type Fe3+/spermidine/putrescine transport system ATPase subunit